MAMIDAWAGALSGAPGGMIRPKNPYAAGSQGMSMTPATSMPMPAPKPMGAGSFGTTQPAANPYAPQAPTPAQPTAMPPMANPQQQGFGSISHIAALFQHPLFQQLIPDQNQRWAFIQQLFGGMK